MQKILCSLMISSLVLVLGCADRDYTVENVSLLMPPADSDSNSDNFWKTIDVENTPLNKHALLEHLGLCIRTGADSQLVIYNGQIVSEWYSEHYVEPIGAMSSTKVVASLLIGNLVDTGLLDYSSRVSGILPEWSGGLRDEVTIEELLTHSGGFEQRKTKDTSIGFARNKRDFVMQITPDFQPGSRFVYSNEGIQLLEPIINKITGEDVGDYAAETIFSKLGMKNTKLYDYGGSAWLYAEMRTTARDMARLGLMMKRNGVWNGQQIVSTDYVEKATTSSKNSSTMGYAWWILDPKKTLRGFYASGYLNTDIYVFEDHDLVIVRTQAPKNGYSGQNESGNYFNAAMRLFKEIVKK